MLETTLSFKNLVQDIRNSGLNNEVDRFVDKSVPSISLLELDAASVTLQKVYKSNQMRRNLASCAVVVEELWWKALDFAALRQISVSFFSIEKHETAASRWARARTRAAKVGKGLSKDKNAQNLALPCWLEAMVSPQEPFPAGHVFEFRNWNKHTNSVKIEAFYGEDMYKFLFPLTSGIDDLKKEVSKRLNVEVDRFELKYMDEHVDLISLPLDEDWMLCLESSQGNDEIRVFVFDKVGGTPN
ncbi:hypothetical protein RHGRI_038685 [Rhododendron griersonianum]|uniref:PB1 domain-containing protein n=1 Tax=Rhododendron griersonianum TaxID=479676 RepID=A0AAV6HMG7_9ERIC|nr:hypothetical protein RHGRI_038685 [Rhododendron griersonianum]